MSRQQLIELISRRAQPFTGEAELKLLADASKKAKIVLLGEASHGTSEYYTVRAAFSKKMIQEHDFRFIAVEGDWPSCYEVNRFIKHELAEESLDQVMEAFNRWPSWMWANEEVKELVKWLREHNASLAPEQRVGFYGLDVYSLWESMESIINHLRETNSPELESALKAFTCFEPHGREGQRYGMSAAFFSETCEKEVMNLLQELQAKRKALPKAEGKEAALSDEINALVAVNAEKYYREMVRGGPESWNTRDEHMIETLERIMEFHGEGAKGIVWEHNTHIGDARATDMAEDGMVNVGQLARESWGDHEVFAIGFGCYKGTVIAGDAWGAPAEIMQVPEAIEDSWEELMHSAMGMDAVLIFNQKPEDILFYETIGHRAIGVVYHPQYERRGNYVPSIMADRYDAFIHIEETRALKPLQVATLYV